MHSQLSQTIRSLVRVDRVGSSLEPDLVGSLTRLVMPNGQPLPGEDVGRLRYPGCCLVLAPPKLLVVDYTLAEIQFESVSLLAWSLPGANYNQVPVDAAQRALQLLSSKRVPRKFQIQAAKIGAEQLDGSNVWQLLLEIVWRYNEPINQDAKLEPLQPDDYAAKPEPIGLPKINIGLWRSEIPMDQDTAVKDGELAIGQ